MPSPVHPSTTLSGTRTFIRGLSHLKVHKNEVVGIVGRRHRKYEGRVSALRDSVVRERASGLADELPHVTLVLAGHVRLVANSIPIRVRTRKARALAALVAYHPNGASRQRLIGLLWPDRAEDQARASLRQAIYELRGHLGSEAFALSDDRIALAPGSLTSDISEAEAAADRGDHGGLYEALGGMDTLVLGGLDGISDELDDWLRTERPNLAARIAGLGRAAAERIFPSDAGMARALCDHALRFDPFDERSLRLALQIDAALGDQAQLHRRYLAFEQRLGCEIQAAPAAETRRLFERLRSPSGGGDRLIEVPGGHAPHAATMQPHPRPEPATRRLRIGWPVLAAGFGLILLLAGAYAVFLHQRVRPTSIPTVAVVPFTTLSGSNQYIATGIADEVQDRLAHQPGVQVLGRFTAHQFRAGSDLLADARRVNATYVLDGTVQADGPRLRVIVGLTRVSDGVLVWSNRFDQGTDDLFKVQSSIAAAVAARFGGGARRPAAHGVSPLPAVYDHYLAARVLMRDRRAVSLAAADRALRQVIAAQPDYAPAHALLAEVLLLEAEHPVSYGTLPFASTRREAREEAELAARLDPQLGETQAALGLLTYSNAASLPFYRRAVELDPQRADFHRWFGQSLMATGHIEEALDEFRRAVAIDPLWGLSYEHLIVALDRANRGAEVAPLVRRFLALSNDERARVQLLFTDATVGNRLADSLRYAQRFVELAPGDRQAKFRYASELAALGAIDVASKVIDRNDWIGRAVLANRSQDLVSGIRAHADSFWDVGSGFWGVDDYLVAHGQGPVLLEVFDRRFDGVGHFRPGELLDPFETAALVVAMRQAGRLAQADELRARLARQVRVENATRLKPEIILLDRTVLNALDGDRAGAFNGLETLSRIAPQMLLGTPWRPLAEIAAFHTLAGDPRLTAIDERLRAALNRERRKLGWAPLR